MSKNLSSYSRRPTQAQPFPRSSEPSTSLCSPRVGPGLFARMTASSFNRVSTYTPSFFLALRANSFRRGVLGV
jgi:hypothetical protein